MERQEFYGSSHSGPQMRKMVFASLGIGTACLFGGLLPILFVINEAGQRIGNHAMTDIETGVFGAALIPLLIGIWLLFGVTRSSVYAFSPAKPMRNFIIDDRAFTVVYGPENAVARLTVLNFNRKLKFKWKNIVSVTAPDSHGVQAITYTVKLPLRKAQTGREVFRGSMQSQTGETVAECLSARLGERAP